jgi:hypothetical protein
MATDAAEGQRREIYEVAEAIAPTWERRRADVEEVSTPVREWMLRELSPRPGDTVLELVELSDVHEYLEDSLAGFAGGGYELPGVVLCAVAK